jgi:hypothetical protein
LLIPFAIDVVGKIVVVTTALSSLATSSVSADVEGVVHAPSAVSEEIRRRTREVECEIERRMGKGVSD